MNVIGPNDNELSCKELSAEIAKANQYADEAQKAKKTGSPHNIGAILFFLPGYGVTIKNVEEATKAAKDRALHLNNLKEKKSCWAQDTGYMSHRLKIYYLKFHVEYFLT